MTHRALLRRALAACALVVIGCSSGDTLVGEDPPGDDTGEAHTSGEPAAAPPSPLRPVELCNNERAAVLYAPQDGHLDVFPDDFFTVASSSATGRHVSLASSALSLPMGTRVFHGVYDELATQDGFGVTSQLFVRFSARIDPNTLPVSGPGSGALDSSVLLFRLDSDPIELVDFEWEIIDDSSELDGPDQTLLISPLQALDERSRYGLAVTTALRSTGGDCIAPSQTMGDILQGRAEGFEHVLPGVSELVAKLEDTGVIDDGGDLTLAVSFHTQSISEESIALTEAVRDRTVSFTPSGPCENDGAGMLTCRGSLSALDFRGDDGVITAADKANPVPMELPITAWLPADATGPFQTAIFGHGLSGNREQAQSLADLVVPPRGGKTRLAVLAVDAPMHGQHPDCATRLCPAVLAFFGGRRGAGLSIAFEGLKFRDNLRQANLDKQHVLSAILAGLDVTDDGIPDFDADAIHYIGGSLGGIMGGEFAAMSPELRTVVLLVPGARLVDVVREIDAAPLLFGSATDGDLARLYPVLQTSFDKGDPGAHARAILGTRVRGDENDRPHLLMQVALDDEIVPNRTSVFYAQNLGLPVLGDEIVPVPGNPRIAELPVTLNLQNSRTAGFYGFDVVCADEACTSTVAATHDNVAFSNLASVQASHFLDSWIETGAPEIIDVYRTEGVK